MTWGVIVTNWLTIKSAKAEQNLPRSALQPKARTAKLSSTTRLDSSPLSGSHEEQNIPTPPQEARKPRITAGSIERISEDETEFGGVDIKY